MKAIVDVAENWNTYVAAHIYTDKAIQRAITAGVKTIEHGMLIQEEETLQMMKDKDVWLSIQPLLDDEDRLVFPTADMTAKWKAVTDGTKDLVADADKNFVVIMKDGKIYKNIVK